MKISDLLESKEPVKVTSHRLPNGWYELRQGDKKVGQAWRFEKKSDGSRQSGWGVKVNGFYWRKGEANKRGGSTATSAPSLTAAVELANKTLNT